MSYLEKLEQGDLDYLREHEDGCKCWQTDYKLLRAKDDMMALSNFEDEFSDRKHHTNAAEIIEDRFLLFPLSDSN